MALITCKDCKKEFSTDAKKCPHCGAKKPVKQWSLKGIIIFLVLLLVVMGRTPSQNHPNVLTDTEIAPQMCQNYVKESLYDPDSAEFDLWTGYFIEQEKNGVFHVQVSLRAKNGFNALRKMVVDCRIKKSPPDKWLLVNLKELK